MATQQRTVLNTSHARQGDTGNGVRYVLGYSLVLAILAMIGTLTFAT